MEDIKPLKPIEQLFLLNKELHPFLTSFKQPLIVIGGQVVNYWLSYFSLLDELTDEQMTFATSVDIDFAGVRMILQ